MRTPKTSEAATLLNVSPGNLLRAYTDGEGADRPLQAAAELAVEAQA